MQFFSLLNANAQEALCSWLSAPSVERGRQMLFRRTYTDGLDIAEARVTIASKGFFRLFVNGRAVFTSYVLGDEPAASDDFDIYTVDVGAYVRRDSNTVAVWYAPEMTTPIASSEDEKDMFALCFYGTYVSGEHFSHISDSTWLCAPSNVLSTSEGENNNSIEYLQDWNTSVPSVQMKWKGAEESGFCPLGTTSSDVYKDFSDCRIDILSPGHFDVSDDSKTISYDFGNGFFGTFRFTVRGAKAGERIWANGSEYVCSGVLDEQFIGRFVHKSIRKIVISGDDSFRKTHIVKVEGLAISY